MILADFISLKFVLDWIKIQLSIAIWFISLDVYLIWFIRAQHIFYSKS